MLVQRPAYAENRLHLASLAFFFVLVACICGYEYDWNLPGSRKFEDKAGDLLDAARLQKFLR